MINTKYYFSLFIVMLQIIFSNLTALEVCKQHFYEIRHFQSIASEFVADAHKSGGNLFRTSFVFTPYDAAMNTFRMKDTYSEFSEAFRDFMYYCNPKGMGPLFAGYSEITDRFYNLYTECIANHQNIHAYYERGKYILIGDFTRNALVIYSLLLFRKNGINQLSKRINKMHFF